MARIAEVSSLAIKKEYRQQRGRILFPLLKFLYHYSYDYFGVTHFVIAVNPKWIDFYKQVLLFKPLSKKTVSQYSFVNNAPAVGAILDLNLAQKVYYQMYNGKHPKRNLSAFFQDLEAKNMEFPLRKRSVISDPVLSPSMLDFFFNKKTQCLSTMNEYEISVLRELYNHRDYLQYIPTPTIIRMKKHCREKRFEASLQGRLMGEDKLSTRVLIRDVGLNGVGGVMKADSFKQGSCRLLVNIEENEPCELLGHFKWNNERGNFGFKITSASASWYQFVEGLDKRLIRIGSDSSITPIIHKVANNK